MTTSPTLKDYPRDKVRFMCKKCGRMGQYTKDHLLGQHGPETALSSLRAKLANCERADDCGVQFVDLKIQPRGTTRIGGGPAE